MPCIALLIPESEMSVDAMSTTDFKAKTSYRAKFVPFVSRCTTTFAFAWLGIIAIIAIVAPLLNLNSAKGDLSSIAAGPSASHWLGTDQLGRDMFARIALGAHNTIIVVVATVSFAIVVGVTAGLVAGYVRGPVESIIGVFVDSILAFPALVLVMALVTIKGASLTILVIGLGLAMTPTYARLARAGTMSFRARDFVTASVVLGTRTRRIIFRDILPNIFPSVLAYSFVIMGVVTIAEGSLSFLGFGVPSPRPSWGNMIADGRASMFVAPSIVLIPAATLFFTVLSLNLVGDYMQHRNKIVSVTVSP